MRTCIQKAMLMALLLFVSTQASYAEIIGTTGGSFRVAEDGSATYQIPIKVPGGITGVTPQMSFSYSSNAGSSSLGRGWSLSGLISITRCPKSYAIDGYIEGVMLDNQDDYCYNGQRLIKHSGTHGVTNAEYHTEIADYSRIRISSHNSNGATGFEITTKSGDIYYLGQTSVNYDATAYAGQSHAPSAYLVAAIRDVQNLSDNQISFDYTQVSGGEVHLDEVTWGGTGSYTHRLKVNYINNPRPHYGFQNGYQFSATKLINNVSIYQTGELVRRYTVGWDHGQSIGAYLPENISRVTQIQECLIDNGAQHCLAPTKFSWSSMQTGTTTQLVCIEWDEPGDPEEEEEGECIEYEERVVNAAFEPFGNYKTLNHSLTNSYLKDAVQRLAGDYDGDGDSDIFVAKNNRWYVLLMASSGTGSTKTIYPQSIINLGPQGEYSYAQVVDFDSDGKQELFYPYNGNWYRKYRDASQYNRSQTIGSYSGSEYQRAVLLDVNGDSFIDLVKQTSASSSLQVKYNRNGVFNSFFSNLGGYYSSTAYGAMRQTPDLNNTAFLDVNGDGISDMITKSSSSSNGTLLIGKSQMQAGANYAARFTLSFLYSVSMNDVRVGDFNGDGLSDLIYRKNSAWHIAISRGNGSFINSTVSTGILNGSDSRKYNYHRFQDINGDGITDLLASNFGHFSVFITQTNNNNVPSFTHRQFLTANLSAGNKLLIGDFDGDTKLDMLTEFSSSISYRLAKKPDERPNVINLVTSGFGQTTNITYGLLQESNNRLQIGSSYYNSLPATRSSSNSNYNSYFKSDLIQPNAGIWVVEKVSNPSYNSFLDKLESVSISYRYSGMLMHKLGRGSLGFEKVSTTDNTTSITTVTTYNQAYPYTGMPVSTIQTYQGKTLSSANNSFSTKFNTDFGTFPYIENAVDKKWRLLKNNSVSFESRTKLYSDYDSFGNLKSSVSTSYDSATSSIELSKTTTTNYYHGAGGGAEKGRLSQSTVTHWRPGQSSKTRTSTFDYEANGLLSWSKINGTGLKTTYDYDYYGNKEETCLIDDNTGETRCTITKHTSDGRFLEYTENELGQRETYRYNDQKSPLGRIHKRSVTGPNNITTTYHLDLQGQLIQESRADGTTTVISRNYVSSDQCVLNAQKLCFSETTVVSGQPTSKVWYDAYGRKAQTQVRNFAGNGWSTQHYTYDVLSRAKTVTEPYNDGYSNGQSPTGFVDVTQYFYDVLGRVIQENLPDGAINKQEYHHLAKHYIDGENNKRIEHFNRLGELVKIVTPTHDVSNNTGGSSSGGSGSGSGGSDGGSGGGDTGVILPPNICKGICLPVDPIFETFSVSSTSTDDNAASLIETITDYHYDVFGNLTRVQNYGSNDTNNKVVIHTVYDNSGRKIEMRDSDKGHWTYTYNAFGEIKTQTSANGQVITNYYDVLGRKYKTTEQRLDSYSENGQFLGRYDAAVHCYHYGIDGSKKNIGKLYKQQKFTSSNSAFNCAASINSSAAWQQELTFDNVGRLSTTTTTFEGRSFIQRQTYDVYGRVRTQTLPEGLVVTTDYQNGYVKRIKQGILILRQTEAMDAAGRIKHELIGNGGMTQLTSYDTVGRVKTIGLIKTGGQLLHDLTYAYDKVGNLLTREHEYQGSDKFYERFDYDTLNRIKSRDVTYTSISTSSLPIGLKYDQFYNYDFIGNITRKYSQSSNGQTVNDYQYNYHWHSHADSNGSFPLKSRVLESIKKDSNSGYRRYIYDLNGNVVSDGSRRLLYTPFDKPWKITSGNQYTEFKYANRNRYLRYDNIQESSGMTQYKTFYVGAYERIERTGSAGNKVEHKYQIAGAVLTRQDGQSTFSILFAHGDYQGSTITVTNQSGQIAEQFIYDPWGKKTKVFISGLNTNLVASLTRGTATTRGYTGHEGIDHFDLIHMNGRVYDAEIGRFLQADPHIQAPTNSQNYNRYSYVLNNPMSYTDPSGYFFKKLWKTAGKLWQATTGSVLRAIAKVPFLNAAVSWGLNLIPGCQGWCSALYNAASTYAVTGSLKSALIGAVTSYASGGGILDAALIGGLASKAQGGNFGHGFWSAGLGAALGGRINVGNPVANVLVSAVVGGTVSKLTGGKFSNGAQTWAFQSIIAQDWSRSKGKNSGSSSSGAGSAAGTCSANPINLATGEKYLTMRDYQAPNHSRLVFERYYSSYAEEKTSLGYGWRHNFDRKLSFDDETVIGTARFVEYKSKGLSTIQFEVSLQDLTIYNNASNGAEKLIKTSTGWQLTLLDGTVELFDEQGRLVQVNEIGNYQQYLHYNSKGLLASVSDNTGQELTLSYNRIGLLTSLETADGITNFEYNLATKVLTKAMTPVNAEGERGYKVYHYDDYSYRKAITSISNELGDTIHHMAYDDEGRAIMSALGDNAERVDVVFLDNRQSVVTNALGRKTTYQFDENNQPITIEGAATPNCIASNQAYEYDERGNIVSQTDWSGTVTTFTYNERNLETSRTEALGTDIERTVTTTWHTEHAVVTSVTTPDNKQVFEYSAQGLLLSQTITDLTAEQSWLQNLAGSYPSRTVAYQYNELGQLIEVDGARTDVNDITRYQYDNVGNQIAVINALGHTSQVTAFDTAGRPTQLVGANGLVTELAYNARGWLSSKTIVTGHGDNQHRSTTQYQYAHSGDYLGKGQVARIISPNGAVTKYSYDKAYRVKSMSNHLGETIEYRRDLAGNTIETNTFNNQGQLVKQQQQQFNELSQLIAQVGANYRIDHRYNGQGLVTKTTNGLGNSTSYAFDALNRLIETTDASGGVIYQRYNNQNKVTFVTDQRGLTTEYQYNGFGEKVKQISPDTGVTTYQYNNAGLLIEKVDNAGQVTEYDYDAIGRIAHIHYVDAANDDIYYQYDEQTEFNELPLAAGDETYAIGQTTKVTDSSGSSQYRYNATGQLTAKVYQLQGQRYLQQNNYNNRGQLNTQTYPSGMVVNYGYDNAGRVTHITQQAVNGDNTIVIDNVVYVPFSGAEQVHYGNGIYQSNRYDIDGRLESIRLSKGFESLYKRNYVYDAANQITDITNYTQNNLSQHYGYDVLGRLTTASGEYGQLSYRYDEVGNRLSRNWQRVNGQTNLHEHYQYSDTSNQLESVQNELSAREFSYNDNGHTAFDSERGKALIYNAANRLRHMTFADGSQADYVYNAKGQRVVKVLTDSNGKATTTHYHFNQQNLLIAETNDNGQPIVEYIYLNNQRIASIRYQDDKQTVDYVHNDHLGSPMLQTNNQADITWRNQTLPFGQEYRTTDVEQGFGFPGQYQDAESGYSYNYFRDYDSSIGRYIQSDPIGLEGGVNTFVYVLSNSILLTDIYGLNPDQINFVRGVPINAQYFRSSYGGHTFNAPPGANFNTVFRAGQNTSSLLPPMKWSQVNADVGHFGNFDFQRQQYLLDPNKFDFIRAYTDSANYAVGVYMNGAGYSLDETIMVSGGFAKMFSSNSGDPAQLKMWKAGWNDAENGQLAEPLNYCPAY